MKEYCEHYKIMGTPHLVTRYQKLTMLLQKKNIQNLMIKFYKYLHSLSTSIMREAFTKESSSNFEVVE